MTLFEVVQYICAHMRVLRIFELENNLFELFKGAKPHVSWKKNLDFGGLKLGKHI